MLYRKNARTNDNISIIGFGTSYIGQAKSDDIVKVVRYAIEHGINYIDLAAANDKIFPALKQAVTSSERKNIFYQVHFGADYSKGDYGRSYRLEDVKHSIDWQLKTAGTDYMDYGMIHCIDDDKVLDEYINLGVLEYIQRLKKQGVVRHIGLSTHTPSILDRVLDMNVIDIAMFSINPAYDYRKGKYAKGDSSYRMQVYLKAQSMGVGISVMKCFGGGQLLTDALSPFGKALTKNQCIHYALDKPGVLTVLPGYSSVEDVQQVLGYLEADEKDKDYSVISSFAPSRDKGRCVYCNHCQPCPAGLDIALINKYYDLAMIGDEMAVQHYNNLEKTAADCVSCGRCNSHCPFGVDQVSRMKKIAEDMGR